jgi:hypothetical protein
MAAPKLATESIDRGLATLSERIRRAARRSYRFSWFAWGFVFSIGLSVTLFALIGLYFAVTVTTMIPGGGTSSSTGDPVWAIPVALLPPVVLLALAVRELVVARREGLRGTPPAVPATHPPASQTEGGWVAAVQQAQKTVTHMKNETEFSFVPLVLGGFTVGGLAALFLPASGAYGWYLVGEFALGIGAALALVLPLYVLARRWIAGYQSLLDRQVGELSRLEAEFLWRFTGTPA